MYLYLQIPKFLGTAYYALREVANRSVIESFSAMFGRLRNFRPQDTEQTPLLGDMAADVTTDGNDDNLKFESLNIGDGLLC